MNKIVLSRNEYRDKVYACWLGKNIGSTLGAPYEGKRFVHDLDFYHPVPSEPAANDDLDLQLVWLKMLEDKGPNFHLPDLAEYWRRYARSYPWNEYGFCIRNLERGLLPPVSGWFENYFVDEMGSPIRSEIWACTAPANPQEAAAMAWMDSCMDHAGGEGMNGEMFWAAVESAAFVVSDPLELIRLGLSMIEPSCAIARVIREAVWCWNNGVRWAEARERIATIFGHVQPCNAVPNHGFIILGWLYGEDFGDKLCKAVNCGYDTDCTGATLGALLGIIGGTAGIPSKWSAPVGKEIVLHKFTGDCNAPKNLDELTDRTVAVAEKMMASRTAPTVVLGDLTTLPEDYLSILYRNDEAFGCLQEDIRSAVAAEGDVVIIFYYNGEPVMYPGVIRTLSVECRKGNFPAEAEIELELPDGWEICDEYMVGLETNFDVYASEVEDSNVVGVRVFLNGRTHTAQFTVLGPGAARGFPAGQNIERCPACGATKQHCVCKRP
jgi:ADP-ribosylglycohydrolase